MSHYLGDDRLVALLPDLAFQRGGKYKNKFKYCADSGEARYLTRAEAINFLRETGMAEDEAINELAEIKDRDGKQPSRGYRLACKPPSHEKDQDMGEYIIAGRKTIIDYFFEANRYANKLVEIERWRRCERQRILEELCPTYGRLCQALSVVNEKIAEKSAEVKKERGRQRCRVSVDSIEAEIVALKARRRDLNCARTVAKKSEWEANAESVKAAWNAIETAATDKKRELRQTNKVLLCQTKTALEKSKTRNRGGLPRFRPVTGEGALTVQIGGGGLPLLSLLSTNHKKGYLHIEPAIGAMEKRIAKNGREYPYRSRGTVYFRIATRDKKPLWAALTLSEAGALDTGWWDAKGVPLTSTIKQAQLTRELIGSQWEWHVIPTVESKTGFKNRVTGTGNVAVDFGWRDINGDLRVIYWRGDDGKHGELRLPSRLAQRLHDAENLASIRDKNFNRARDQLVIWLRTHTIPEWLHARTKTLSHWRSTRRLSRLVREWCDRRFDGDESILPSLIEWRSRKDGYSCGEEHLFNWGRQMSRKVQRARLQMFRNFVAMLRKNYNTIGIENINMKKLCRSASVEEPADAKKPRWNMRLAAVGLLKTLLVESGMAVYMLDPADTSNTCQLCGYVNDFGSELEVTCAECKSPPYDRDFNAAGELLNRLYEARVARRA